MQDVEILQIIPNEPADENLLDWAERYMIILDVPRTHSKSDPCYRTMFLDLFEYIKEVHE